MKTNSGISVGIVILIIAVVLGIGGGAFYFLKDTGTGNLVNELPVETTLEGEISAKLGKVVGDLERDIFNGKYFKGNIEIDGQVNNVFAISNNGRWNVVHVSTGAISCEKGRSLNFPESYLIGCSINNPNAKTVAEAKNSGGPSTIVGIINLNDPSGGVTITSGGETATVGSSSGGGITYQNVDDGEVVIVEGDVSTDDDGNTTVSTDTVSDQDEEDEDDLSDSVSSSSSSNDDSSDSSSSDDISDPSDVSEPVTSTPSDDSEDSNLLDINRSGVQVTP